jgi:hypothetical protein
MGSNRKNFNNRRLVFYVFSERQRAVREVLISKLNPGPLSKEAQFAITRELLFRGKQVWNSRLQVRKGEGRGLLLSLAGLLL